MSPLLQDAPTLLFDIDAPRARPQPVPRGGTLDDLITGALGQLAVHATVPCPVCGGALAPRYGAGAAAVGGRCRDCDSTLG